jgi:histidinol-phosphatase (PHP family)
MSGVLPADDHVHTEWSWDADEGSMERTCSQAVELGLVSVAFTEHLDHTRWYLPPEVVSRSGKLQDLLGEDGRFDPPPLDVEGYLDSIERCRARFPSLRVLTGVEIGEPHWHPERTGRLLATGAFERVLGSQHSLRLDGERWITDLAGHSTLSGYDLVRAHLAETLQLITADPPFEVLAHVDYAVRAWPQGDSPFDPCVVEEELREVLGALAASGRTLEVNTKRPLEGTIVAWWREEGGATVTFGSDAHRPDDVAAGFAQAAAMVEAQGFRPGRDPHDRWRR